MKMHRAILMLTCVMFLGACATSQQRAPGQPPRSPAQARPAPRPQGVSPLASGEQSTTPGASAPSGESQAGGPERSIDISSKAKEDESSKSSKKTVLPSLTGKFEAGLLGVPSKAKPEAPVAPSQEKQKIVLNFEKADIAEVTSQIFGDYLKLNYVLDPTLQGRVSLYLEGEYTKDEMFQMITKAYEANNVSIVPRNGIYYLQPVQRASSGSLPVADSLILKPDKEGVRPVIVMYRLRYMDVKQAINTIKFFLSPGRPITSDSMTNSVIFVEDTENAQSIVSVLQALDINILQEVSMEIVPVTSLTPQDASQSMEALIGKMDIFKDSTIKGSVAFVPLQNFGGVLVLARNPEIIKTAKHWISALDVHSAESGEQIHVYFVQNALATDIGDILNQVFGLKGASTGSRPEQQIVQSTRTPFGSRSSGTSGFGSSFGSSSGSSSGMSSSGSSLGTSSFGSSSSRPFGSSATPSSGFGSTSTGSRPGTTGTGSAGVSKTGTAARVAGATGLTPPPLTGEVIVIPDEVNNAIVIRANAPDYTKIKKTIETLDILPRAVLIEVMIAEITLTKQFQYGLQWFLNEGGTHAGFNLPQNLADLTFRNIDVAGGGLGLLFRHADDFQALIRLIQSKTSVNILSAPTLLATDNKEASIQVGGREPVPTGSVTGATTGDSVLSTIQYEETGTILNVTPHINAGGLVRLEVEQTVRRLGPPRTVGQDNSAPSFLERNVKTTLLAQSGSTVVIGGIIDATQQNTRDGIPFLMDVPLLSPLFSTKTKNETKTELIVAITPHVVGHRESDSTREFLDKLRDLRRRIEQ